MLAAARSALLIFAAALCAAPSEAGALPADLVAWERARGWSEHHARWHAERRWALLSPATREWAARRGWKAAARPEGAPGSGREFLLMHRAMLQLLRERFPERAALLAGWPSPPERLLDARMAAAVRRLAERLDSFPSEDALGRYIETDLRPRTGAPGALAADPSAGVHTRLHERLADSASAVDAGDPTVNFENEDFWGLHGWIDGRWEAYRRLRGLDDGALSYREELAAARAHMDHEGAPPLAGPVPEEIGRAFFRATAPDPQYLVFWLTDDVFEDRVQAKAELFQRSLPAWLKAGGDGRRIAPPARRAGERMDARDAPGAEAALDRLLAIIGVAPPPPRTSAVVEEKIDAAVSRLVAEIGATGDGRARRLGFGLPLPVFAQEDQLPAVIRAAFAVARKRDVAVAFGFDSHYFWEPRPDLWKDPENVEWSDWNGAPSRARYIDWGVPQKLAPHMCYNSPKILREIARLAGRVIGPAVKAELDALAKEDRSSLFAGMNVDSEPSLDDYTRVERVNPALARFIVDDGVGKARFGYHALHNLGYGPGRPPKDLRRTLAEVNRDFIAYWAEKYAAAGIPPSRLYTHVGGMLEIGHPLVDFTNAPAWIAFNGRSRPGWTTYPGPGPEHGFAVLYEELHRHGDPAWGGVEANADFGGSAVDWDEYLSRHFDHGAKFVGINIGASGGLQARLRRSAYAPGALAAYRRFLSGGRR